MRRLICLPLILLTAGCTLVKNPSPIGRGYSSYNEPYKSAPGPKAPGIGYDYSAETNAEVTSIWRASVQDLVTRLESETGLSASAIRIVPPDQPGAMTATFSHVLHEELASRGYTFDPASTLHVGFDIDKPKGSFLSNEQVEDEGYEKLRYRDFLLTLASGDNAVTDTYYLPTAGSEALRNKIDYEATKKKVYNP